MYDMYVKTDVATKRYLDGNANRIAALRFLLSFSNCWMILSGWNVSAKMRYLDLTSDAGISDTSWLLLNLLCMNFSISFFEYGISFASGMCARMVEYIDFKVFHEPQLAFVEEKKDGGVTGFPFCSGKREIRAESIVMLNWGCLFVGVIVYSCRRPSLDSVKLVILPISGFLGITLLGSVCSHRTCLPTNASFEFPSSILIGIKMN